MAEKDSEANLPLTNDDAANAKYNCVTLGYFEDEFLQYFVRDVQKRQPIINRGYYARVSVYRRLIKAFIEKGGTQIINLGAGFDTSFFTLCSKTPTVTYYEVDFPEVVRTKSYIICNQSKLLNLLVNPKPRTTSGDLSSDNYHLFAADLRDLKTFEQKIKSCGIDCSKPTLILSECVLVYLTVEASGNLIRWASATFLDCLLILYEPIKPNDNFGKMMIQNMQSRGCPLLSVTAFPTLESQKNRFLSLGWQNVYAVDMNYVYNNLLDTAENERVEKLEIFDELEEWFLIHSHYCLALAVHFVKPDSLWANFSLDIIEQNNSVIKATTNY
eukprot:TRINITY_DN10911_c0_g1_i1.p1 TRINITY_DN10911_c0_g1~~TRINITY_DN10911_c0_g1_i1.p1  ORF type:complete len:338 (-),score=47.05 TRINITY_DN10911_c0_g1_i1:27-1013(-)